MPEFSNRSLARLGTCHPDLIWLFDEIIKEYDCTIIEGHRSRATQAEYFRTGRSKVEIGKHNHVPSLAIDVAPYPIDWKDLKRFYHFAGYVQAWADGLDMDIRWGGDWDGDNNFDQDFNDLVHYEITPK